MNNILRRGVLIVLEGCDRVGKTTHCHMLAEALKKEGNKVEILHFPDRSTTIGNLINKYLEGTVEIEAHAVHLLFSANRWETIPRMKQLLNNGVILIVDRYAYSGVAFSAAKKGMDLTWCKQPDTGLFQPDLVIFLDLPVDVSTKRNGFGDERYEHEDFQKQVKDIFSHLQEDNWLVINANRKKEDVHAEIKSNVDKVIKSISSPEIKRLWTDNDTTNDGN